MAILWDFALSGRRFVFINRFFYKYPTVNTFIKHVYHSLHTCPDSSQKIHNFYLNNYPIILFAAIKSYLVTACKV